MLAPRELGSLPPLPSASLAEIFLVSTLEDVRVASFFFYSLSTSFVWPCWCVYRK